MAVSLQDIGNYMWLPPGDEPMWLTVAQLAEGLKVTHGEVIEVVQIELMSVRPRLVTKGQGSNIILALMGDWPEPQ